MAMGKLSSLGVGSSVLSYDVLEKLRKADEQSLIAPVDKKIELNVEKQKELVDIKDSLAAVKQHVGTLSDYSTYIRRKVSVDGGALTATADPGVPTQDISVEVKRLAKGDINEIGTKFASKDDEFSKEDAVLEFFSNESRYRVSIRAGMSVNDVAQAITDETGGKVMGVVMKTGGLKPYQLMINSKRPGEDGRIYFGSMVKSEKLDDRPISLHGEEDFFVSLHDKYGNLQRISLDVDIDDKLSLQEKAELIRSEIRKKIEENPGTGELVENGDINVGLADGGRSLLINDRRGYKIKVGGSKAGLMGFPKHTQNSKSTNLYESTINAKHGKLKGVIKIGRVPIDLAVLTKEKNTSIQNAQAIVEAVQNIAGIDAKREQGRIILNSSVGELKITYEDEDGKRALSDLGLKPGRMFDYTHMQRDLFMFKNVQSGSDAEIKVNGATVRRSTNTIDDVISGLHLNLLHTTEEDKPVTVSITEDVEDMVKEIKGFVESYNELVPKLDASTRYDAESRKGGIFNTESEIRNIRPRINQAFLHTVGDGTDVRSLVTYGLTIDDKSRMRLDETKLTNMIRDNVDSAKNLFYGQEKKSYNGSFTRIDGVFAKLKSVLADLLDGPSARINRFEQKLDKEMRNHNKDKEKSRKMLDARYDTMANRFAAYDERIARANNSFSAVQMMIDQAAAKKK